jgi:hypothetical protein
MEIFGNKGCHEIPCMEYKTHLAIIHNFHGGSQQGEAVMGIRHQAYKHGYRLSTINGSSHASLPFLG